MEEKQEIFRKRNAANLRKSRERRKNEDMQDQILFEENERKIVRLESLVQDMEKELNDETNDFSTGLAK